MLDADLETVRHFRDVLVRLSSPAEEQIRTRRSGTCLACDLVNDYEDADFTSIAMQMRESQKELWQRIGHSIGSMQPRDVECNNDEVVLRPTWQEVRGLACELLRLFESEVSSQLP